jgi:uncharacterized membrane protein YhaH (DUF805 family)
VTARDNSCAGHHYASLPGAAMSYYRGVIKMNDLLSMAGRYNRSRYVFTTLGICLVTYALTFLMGLLMRPAGSPESAGIVGGIIGVAANVVLAFVAVKRLHDLDRSGWHYWLLLVPLYNIYLGLLLLFQKGTAGSNRFGVDPVAS